MGPTGPCSSRSGSWYSMSRTCGARDIISLVIPKVGDNKYYVPVLSHIETANPNHGLSLKSTQSVCVMEDVSRSCNHQHSLSAREAFSIRPSLSRKYSNFVLVVVINTPSQLENYSSPSQFGEDVCNLLMCRKVQHVYFFPLHHVSENDILSQCVLIYHETQGSQRVSHNSGYNHRIHLMIK
jgi:hypothetical protein